MNAQEKPSAAGGIASAVWRWLAIILTLATAIPFLIGGIKLASLGGSLYYLIAGALYVIAAILLIMKRHAALWLSSIIFVATCVWAIYEVGGIHYWELMARLVVPTILFVLTLFSFATYKPESTSFKRGSLVAGLLGVAGLLATFVGAFFPHGSIYNPDAFAQQPTAYDNDYKSDAQQDWDHIARTAGGTRFAPLDQINRDNVKDLKVAWTYRTGRRLEGKAIGVDENTPLQIGSTLYSCTPENIISAIDADTGKQIWRVDPHARTFEHVTCRGVGYYDVDRDDTLSAAEKAAAPQMCRQRIITTTVDARMLALDAHTGQACEDFGDHGSVDLQLAMGDTANSKNYHPSSIPVVMGHLTVFGSWVRDITENEPSGVLRAYDVRTGDLAWAWDVGNLEGHAKGAAQYTLSTPNVWAVPTFDKKLNTVYVATGNGPPDYWGGNRNTAKEKFGSALVALDASTGRTKWVYQTVHHDVWDYDLPSQPVMYDMKNEQGETVPVLIQTTKMGQIFVIDRRTGKPASKVVEKAVPTQPAAREEHLSPTQPFSVDMPSLAVDKLSEKDMWGISPFDQLQCRIAFKSARYTGLYTTPSEATYLEIPATLGGQNWGGFSIDERNGMMYVNDIRMGMLMSLKTREEAAKYKVSLDEVPQFAGTLRPQVGGPYGGVRFDNFVSSLEVPCQKPPFGTMTAIDLNTKKIAWQVPMGTVQDTGPMGIKTHLPLPIGMPTLGGPTATAGGLVFYAGTQDNYLRALDSHTGKEVWKARLPVGATASPLIYQSPKTGRQYVVISAGGAAHAKDVGDYIIAYALPEKK